MQDVQNIPNPDINSNQTEDDFDTHPRPSDAIERPEEDIPLLPDDPRRAPVEEPPDEQDKPPIQEDQPEPKMIV